MTRGVSASLLAALSGHFHPVLLIEADWPSGIVRLHSGVGELSWNGETWSGTSVSVGGDLMSLLRLEIPEEGAGLGTPEAFIHVAGRLEDIVGELGTKIRNRPLQAWFGATTERAGTTLIGDPFPLFTGYFASRDLDVSKSGADMLHDMILGLGTGPSARSRASIEHNYEDQIAAYPGDTAGRHVQNALKHAANPRLWPEP